MGGLASRQKAFFSGQNTKKFISHLVNKQTIISLPFSNEMTFLDKYMYIHVVIFLNTLRKYILFLFYFFNVGLKFSSIISFL